MANAPWYRNGLRFACTQCGRCCGGGPGTIRANDEEIAALAARLGLDDATFRERYTRRLRSGDISLIEKEDHDCVFYDRRRGCTVYADRPRQCQTWPFWRAIVFSPDTWSEEALHCPGMDLGVLHSHEEIAERLVDDGTSASRRRRKATARSRGSSASRRRVRGSHP
jgi:Fe-S-cluster containining protein